MNASGKTEFKPKNDRNLNTNIDCSPQNKAKHIDPIDFYIV